MSTIAEDQGISIQEYAKSPALLSVKLWRMERILYGSHGDFIRDHMSDFLSKNIISKPSSEAHIWKQIPAKFTDLPRCAIRDPFEIPYVALEYHDQTVFLNSHVGSGTIDYSETHAPLPHSNHIPYKREKLWNIDFVQVELPEGWSLETGCECGAGLDASSFVIKDGDEIKATASYFPGELRFNSGLSEFLDMFDEALLSKKN